MHADLPPFLRGADAFSQHLQDQLHEKENTGKGDSFVGFACKVLPFLDLAKDYGEPQLSRKKSHDGGVDFHAAHKSTTRTLAGQSKLRIREVSELNTIISKFQAYEATAAAQAAKAQSELFGDPPSYAFVVITSSNIEEIRRRYEQSALPTIGYYKKLSAEDRIHIVDGPQLLTTLQNLYRQSYLLSPEIDLEFAGKVLAIGNVRISVVTGKTLRHLYDTYGSSLFFENIRDFLGVSSKNGEAGDANVNDAIVDTLKHSPSHMLGRNNGITFRAEKITDLGEQRVLLSKGSIVNGCQTTMCIVNVGEAADSAMVVVKVVGDDDSWEVAKSANHQNRVTRIDLEIARFLRPQLVRKVATDLGYGMSPTSEPSISNVLSDIHLAKISYDAIKLLYLGFFSRHPNNLFESHYSEVRVDILNAATTRNDGERILRILFQLWMQLGKARDGLRERLQKSDERILDLFKRFFEQDKVSYHCLLAILTACGCVNEDLAKKPSEADEAYRSLLSFFIKLEVVLTNHQLYFERVFRHAFGVISERVLAQSKGGDVPKDMWRDVVNSAGKQFANTVIMLRTRMASDELLEKDAPQFDLGASGSGAA